MHFNSILVTNEKHAKGPEIFYAVLRRVMLASNSQRETMPPLAYIHLPGEFRIWQQAHSVCSMYDLVPMQEEPDALERYLMVIEGKVRCEVFLSCWKGMLRELLVTFPVRGAKILGSCCVKQLQETLDADGLSWDSVFTQIEGWTDDRQKFVREHYLAAFLPKQGTHNEMLHRSEVRELERKARERLS